MKEVDAAEFSVLVARAGLRLTPEEFEEYRLLYNRHFIGEVLPRLWRRRAERPS
jgi:hypothetical protein